MESDMLEVLFQLGNLLTITPSSTKIQNEKLSRKFRALIIITFYTIFSLFSFLERYNSMKSLILLSIEALRSVIFYIFNLYVIFVSNFLNRNQWNEILRNIDKVMNLIPIKRKQRNIWIYVFFFINLLYFLLIFIIIYLRFSTSYLKKFAIRYIEFYISFFYDYLIVTIVLLFLRNYQLLLLYTTDHKYGKNNRLKHIATAMYLQKKTVHIFNNLLGWPVAFLILNNINQSIFYLITIIYYKPDLDLIIIYIILFLINLVGINVH